MNITIWAKKYIISKYLLFVPFFNKCIIEKYLIGEELK